MDKKNTLKNYKNLSYDKKIEFIKTMNELSLEEMTKVKSILDVGTDPKQIEDDRDLRKGFDWLVDNKYFDYFIYATIFVWFLFFLNLFTLFDLGSFLRGYLSSVLGI